MGRFSDLYHFSHGCFCDCERDLYYSNLKEFLLTPQSNCGFYVGDKIETHDGMIGHINFVTDKEHDVLVGFAIEESPYVKYETYNDIWLTRIDKGP